MNAVKSCGMNLKCPIMACGCLHEPLVSGDSSARLLHFAHDVPCCRPSRPHGRPVAPIGVPTLLSPNRAATFKP
jgi:hypothetical protein